MPRGLHTLPRDIGKFYMGCAVMAGVGNLRRVIAVAGAAGRHILFHPLQSFGLLVPGRQFAAFPLDGPPRDLHTEMRTGNPRQG